MDHMVYFNLVGKYTFFIETIVQERLMKDTTEGRDGHILLERTI